MKIPSPLLSAVCFLVTFLGYVGLQFAPHISAGMNQALYSIMALTLGHALGASTSGGTVAQITLPGNTSTSTASTVTGSGA
jgi:hypothetical protein